MKFHAIDCQGKLIVQRLTSAERGSATPSAGKVVYDTDLNKIYYGDGIGWNEFGSGGSTSITPLETKYIDITGTSDEGGFLSNTIIGADSTSATYYIDNFTGGTGFDPDSVRGLYIRSRVRQVALNPEYARVSCSYPDSTSTPIIILESFNNLTAVQEGTGLETICLVPINSLQPFITIILESSDVNGLAEYEIIGCAQLSDSNYEIDIFPGVVVPYGSDSIPNGWLLCDGSVISRTIYSRLFAITGEKYGVGDGATTFNIPDLRGRFALGVNKIVFPNPTRVPAASFGLIGGKHQHTLTIAELPRHTHETSSKETGDDGTSHAAGINRTSSPNYYTSTSSGFNQPHPTIPPYQVFNFIIKT